MLRDLSRLSRFVSARSGPGCHRSRDERRNGRRTQGPLGSHPVAVPTAVEEAPTPAQEARRSQLLAPSPEGDGWGEGPIYREGESRSVFNGGRGLMAPGPAARIGTIRRE